MPHDSRGNATAVTVARGPLYYVFQAFESTLALALRLYIYYCRSSGYCLIGTIFAARCLGSLFSLEPNRYFHWMPRPGLQ